MTRPALHLATDADAPPASGSFVPQAAARHAFTSLEGAFHALKRAMSGPSTPEAMRGEIARLTDALITEAGRVKRFTR